jgi:hypothetical protein
MKSLKNLTFLVATCCALGAFADTPAPPTITTYSNSTIILGITENGKYAIFETRGDDASGGKILDIESGKYTDVTSTTELNGSVADLSNDGEIVVGSYSGKPAYWTRSTGTWTTLGSKSGSAVAITADGKYAVGHTVIGNNEYTFNTAMWDLTTGKTVTLNNVPSKDLSNGYENQNRFNNISADGRYIVGVIDVSYVGYQAFYVYDRETETYDYIGFDETSEGRFTPKADGLYFIDTANMSASGKWVTGSAYIVKSSTEYETAYRYNCETKEFELFDNDGDSGIVGFGIDDNGVVYAATPTTSPLRDAYVRRGEYWFGLSQILSQRYGVNFTAKTGLDQTGTPTSISSDGRIFGSFTDPSVGEGYIMKLNESLYDACESVDLLGNYSVTPVSGASFSALTSMTINFDRNVTVKGATNSVQVYDSTGKSVRKSIGISANGAKLTIQFRPYTFAEGETYTVSVPAGTVSMASDAAILNREINISYTGRANTPVAVKTIYPTPDTSVSKFDYSSSHILINYDTNILAADGVTAKVYRNDEPENYATMSLEVSGSQLILYPVSTLYFYKDNAYRIELPAGAVTDLGGSCANEALTINYTGNYEREVSSSDKVLFSEDFSNGFGTQLMFYEGDGNMPTSEMQGYSFTQYTYPWQIAYDADVKDYCIMSHSSYEPAGTSDDWMVIPHLYIPDDNCYISFDSQGFNRLKEDRLHVYVIPAETIYNELTTAAIEDFKANRILVYDEIQDPGSSEKDLLGDWTPNEIDLSAYAGRDVYIAFVNENYDQSILFVDNINVIHDMRFATIIDNETSVVAKDNVDIYGRISVQSALASYSSAKLELMDADANVIDTIEESGLNLDKDNSYSFRFSKPLPLEIGKETTFKLRVTLDDEGYILTRTITDLAFMPTKRVFLEEYAGSTCGNCPLGILAIEKLQKELPDNFIPVSIRTYDNDALGNGLSSYSLYLGLDNMGAPSACIDRKYLAYPMAQDSSGIYVFNAPEGTDALWTDIVYSELETPAIADINVEASLSEDGKTLTIPFDVTYALDTDNVNVSVLLEVIENNLTTYQRNYLYTTENQPNLGEWQKGGIYSNAEYVYPVTANDVVRALIGLSYNGTQGYVPSTVVAGVKNSSEVTVNAPERVEDYTNAEVVAILIDNNTDAVVNAAKCHIATSGVAKTLVDSSVAVSTDAEGNISVTASSSANVAVYDLTGKLIAMTSGNNPVARTNGYRGVAIVKVTTENGISVNKLIIK